MTLKALLSSDDLKHLYDVIVPTCDHAEGASSPDVIERLTFLYEAYRPHETAQVTALLDSVRTGLWKEHPYFPTFAETVIEAYWTSDTGLAAVGFNRTRLVSR